MTTVSNAAAVPRQRDIRLDFFRGLGMFIIFIAHVPSNTWSLWIPARFGFSDATEIFVFCSGMASAIAFASVFEKRGFLMGTARIAHRSWQVYWAHIGLFFAAAAMLAGADLILGTGISNISSLNLQKFITTETASCLAGLFTLTYVPNLFDILPMYLIILMMIPLVMLLSRAGPFWPILFCLVLWAIATQGYWRFPAEPWSERRWYFNPLAWQLVFFTGFAFIRGWIPAPPIDKRLVWLAAIIVVISMFLNKRELVDLLPKGVNRSMFPSVLMDKSNFGIFRYVHFLALAYLAYAAAGDKGARLSGAFVAMCCRVGQQALAVFIAGIMLALFSGIVLRQAGYTAFNVALANLTGMALLIAVAYTVAWFKRTPWKQPHKNKIILQRETPTGASNEISGARS